jgi:hypothetical protein
VLLVTGLLSFGFIAMIFYLIAGPDHPKPVTGGPSHTRRASRDVLHSSSA